MRAVFEEAASARSGTKENAAKQLGEGKPVPKNKPRNLINIMNLYPIYGHLGFKLFFAACAFRAAEFAKDTADDRRQLLEELRKLNQILAAQQRR